MALISGCGLGEGHRLLSVEGKTLDSVVVTFVRHVRIVVVVNRAHGVAMVTGAMQGAEGRGVSGWGRLGDGEGRGMGGSQTGAGGRGEDLRAADAAGV